MTRAIVAINAGSSSIKFGLFTLDAGGPHHAAGGKIEGIGTAPHLIARDEAGTLLVERRWPDGATLSHEALLAELVDWARTHLDGREIVAVGHRVVHGGADQAEPALVTPALLETLDALCPLAPLHQPHNLAAIHALATIVPGVPQVACFDTGFHQARPPLASWLALPRRFHDTGIRRYGFHGLSYAYLARRLREIDPVLARGRVLVAHLGNGASLCAMRDGTSVDTSMGFTALDGLMMGTRAGAIDPGVVLHLIQQMGMDADTVSQLLYNQSGLLGVSAVSSDMRALHASDDPRAAEAVALFVWRVVREAGALIALMGGIDAIVFSAGIGENDPLVRAAVCDGLAWLGIAIDAQANEANALRISAAGSKVAALVVPTDEERMIAIGTVGVLAALERGTAQ